MCFSVVHDKSWQGKLPCFYLFWIYCSFSPLSTQLLPVYLSRFGLSCCSSLKLSLTLTQAELDYPNTHTHTHTRDRELPDVHAGFRKSRGTRDQIANIHWIIEKAREFQKNVCFCFIDYAKAFDCVDHNKLWKILKEMGILDHLTCLLRTYILVRKQQLELDMEQQTGSK